MEEEMQNVEFDSPVTIESKKDAKVSVNTETKKHKEQIITE